MRLVCWNVNKRVREGLKRQVEALERFGPGVVGLQEITPTTSDAWLVGLAAIGLEHGVSSLDLVPEARVQRGRPDLGCCWRVGGRLTSCRSGTRG